MIDITLDNEIKKKTLLSKNKNHQEPFHIVAEYDSICDGQINSIIMNDEIAIMGDRYGNLTIYDVETKEIIDKKKFMDKEIPEFLIAGSFMKDPILNFSNI